MAWLALVLRVAIALNTQGFFQPDEYFQALEPAHHYVFGYGYLTWEWVSPAPLRSIIYPALNIPPFWLIKTLGLDTKYPELLIAGPRIVHGLLAAITDIALCEVTRQVLNDAFVPTAYLVSLTSLFHSLSLSRSMSNSLETSLTTAALSYYPWDVAQSMQVQSNRTRMRMCIAFAALACAIRPTNAIIWVYMFGLLFTRLGFRPRHIFAIVRDCFFALDSAFYGKPTLSLLNFLRVNASPVSLFYGSNPWHYYVSQALPILCSTSLPFVLHGMRLAVKDDEVKLKTMLGCIVWTITAFSFVGHKEWRFLHPLLPMLHVFASRSLVELYHRSAKAEIKVPQKKRKESATFSLPIRTRDLCLLLLTVPASIYVVFFHSVGQIKVMSYLRSLPSENLTSVGFLTPCHSTPWQAYLHRPELAAPGRMWALGCEPPLGLQHPGDYKDQTDIFFEAPFEYMRTHFPSQVDYSYPASPFALSIPNVTFVETIQAVEQSSRSWDLGWLHEWPQYIVLFGALLREPGMLDLFRNLGYEEVWKGGFEWEGEGQRKGAVRVWKHIR
ncbi:glycosyltransferase family 22 protein [Suillus paluster]|uniref:glycosyltransferase family 22 protein n=1 Tax=Suillus paluster TaxID=48578 RepID=UPI001B88564D|nr:glycosyltransferase family 22 protein [Suillus paluster]KAG1756415.1 glycosyltransferase family 22 protein [Suillus paluster]